MELKARREAALNLSRIRTKKEGLAMAVGRHEKDEEEEEEIGEPLSPAGRLFHTRHFNCYIITAIGVKTELNPEAFKNGLQHTLVNHPRFSSKLVEDKRNGGKKRWIPTTVKIEIHVIVPNLEPNADSGDDLVGDYITAVTNSPLDPSRPLWEVHLLNIKTSHAEAVAVFRVHHSIGDGASLMSLLLACTRQSSDPDALPTIPASKRKHKTNQMTNQIWSTLRLIWNTFVDLAIFVATIIFLRDTDTPIKGDSGVEFKPKRFVHRTLNLDHIKLVRRAMNATINDVALGITQAGLSRYLNRRLGGEERKNNIPANIRVRSSILVNIRPTPGIQDLAVMMDEKSKAKWGNGIGYIILPLTIGLQDDPLNYIRTAKASMDRKKLSLEAICSYFVALPILKLFGIKVATFLSQKVLCNTTLSFSNIVGPQEEIDLYGHPVAYIAPSVYGHPHALTFHWQSYGNKMTISVTVDPDVIPDPYQLCDDFEESLKLIKDAVLMKGL